MMPDWLSRIARTIVQLIAGGGLALLFDQLARDVPASYAPYVVIGATLLVTICQNVIEDATGRKLLGPSDVVTTGVANRKIEQAFVATPGVDTMPRV